jgi:VCBS repeat-containing protein
VLGNDIEIDSPTLTPVKVSNPTHGTVTLNADGSFSYTPTANYIGSDSFNYKVNDGQSDSNMVIVNITVMGAVNNLPVANSQLVIIVQGSILPITLTATDADGNPLT